MIHLFHLSDLHIALQHLGDPVKNPFLQSMKARCRDLTPGEKLLIITGDFCQLERQSYEDTLVFLRDLIQCMGIDVRQDVFLVPGDREMLLPLGKTENRPYQLMTKGTGLHLAGMDRRSVDRILSEGLESYNQFCRDLGVYTQEENPAELHVRTWRDRLNVLHLNTVLDGEAEIVPHMEKVFDYTIRDQLQNGLPTIALGHHSYHMLHSEVQRTLYNFFVQEEISAYLCGDQGEMGLSFALNPMAGAEYGNVQIPVIGGSGTYNDGRFYFRNIALNLHLWDEKTGSVDLQQFRWATQSSVFQRVNEKKQAYSLKGDELFRIREGYEAYIRSRCERPNVLGLSLKQSERVELSFAEPFFVPMTFQKVHSISSQFHGLPCDPYKSWEDRGTGGQKNILNLRNLIPQKGVFRYLVMGSPGSGKTALLRLLAKYYISPTFHGAKELRLTKRKLYPLWISCRDFCNSIVPLEGIIGALGVQMKPIREGGEEVFLHYMQERLHGGTALLLIDGLDEIRDYRARSAFVANLEDFIRRYPLANILITGRENGFASAFYRSFSAFQKLRIRGLSQKDIISFCGEWESLVQPKNSLKELAGETLGSEIIGNEKMLHLARNPLLLSLLLSMGKTCDKLPTQRIGVYEAGISALLSYRRFLPLETVRHQLGYIAFYMATEKPVDGGNPMEISGAVLRDLLDCVQKEFPQYIKKGKEPQNLLLNFLKQCKGIMVQTGESPFGNDTYEFCHHSIQDYFAAYGACTGCYPHRKPEHQKENVLDQYLWDPNMREVLLFAAEMDATTGGRLSELAIEEDDRQFLWEMLQNEVVFDQEHLVKIFDCLFENPFADLYKVGRILKGIHGKAVRKYFQERDQGEHWGYPIWETVGDYCSKEIPDLREFYLAHRWSERPEDIIRILCAFICKKSLPEKEDWTDFLLDVKEWLQERDPLVCGMAAILVETCNLTNDNDIPKGYVEALIRSLNSGFPLYHNRDAVRCVSEWLCKKLRHKLGVQLSPQGSQQLLEHSVDPHFSVLIASVGGGTSEVLEQLYALLHGELSSDIHWNWRGTEWFCQGIDTLPFFCAEAKAAAERYQREVELHIQGRMILDEV